MNCVSFGKKNTVLDAVTRTRKGIRREKSTKRRALSKEFLTYNFLIPYLNSHASLRCLQRFGGNFVNCSAYFEIINATLFASVQRNKIKFCIHLCNTGVSLFEKVVLIFFF